MNSDARSFRGSAPAGRRCRLGPLVVLAALTAAFPAPATAQSPDRATLREIERRVDTMAPTSGPPGTKVRVASGEMPSITPIRVGLGGVRSGFESLISLLTTMDGEFDVTLELPRWATWDRVHRFVVFDIYFKPIALSELFHVTNEEGFIHRRGRVVEASGGCLRLDDVDGVTYALDGATAGLDIGSSIVVEGPVRSGGGCGIPYTIDVVRTPGG
ncbi:MAG: hypothetical protein RJQ04_14465 [Longimicrobiales bacterium]